MEVSNQNETDPVPECALPPGILRSARARREHRILADMVLVRSRVGVSCRRTVRDIERRSERTEGKRDIAISPANTGGCIRREAESPYDFRSDRW